MKHNSKTAIVLAGVFVVLAVVLIGCGGGGGGGGGYGGSAAPPAAMSTVQPVTCPTSGTTDISIVSMVAPGFNPSSQTVPLNTTVKWTNMDTILHTVTSQTVPAGGTFDNQVSPGTSVCLKFTAAGTFNYHCSIHPTTMIGLVTVQ